jgi:hypothetical protein
MIRFVLQSERLGPLPLVNHFIQRMGLEDTCWPSRNRPSCREMAPEIKKKSHSREQLWGSIMRRSSLLGVRDLCACPVGHRHALLPRLRVSSVFSRMWL